MIAVRAGLQTDLESASGPDASNAPRTSKYDGEANTDIYTRIAWGHLSVCTGRGATVFPDAGEFYANLATLIGSWLPPKGVFLDLGCGVRRTETFGLMLQLPNLELSLKRRCATF